MGCRGFSGFTVFSLSLSLFVEKKKAVIGTAQERWCVATRAFNRDKRSCHGPGNGITKAVRLESLSAALYLHKG